YPDGKVRDYKGERFLDRSHFVPPFTAHDRDELCQSPPVLGLGSAQWVRRGREPISAPFMGGNCVGNPNAVGSAAVAIDIPEPGSYRFGALLTNPPGTDQVTTLVPTLQQVSLALWSSCAASASTIACESGEIGPAQYVLPVFTVTLDKGRYYLVT